MDQKSKDAGIALGIHWASKTIPWVFRKSCKSMFVSVVVSTEDGYASYGCACAYTRSTGSSIVGTAIMVGALPMESLEGHGENEFV